MQRLTGKVAIITGGGGGIGSGTAKRLAEEGAKVVCADIHLASARRAVEALGGQGLAVECDSADDASVKALVERTLEHFGRLDILFNNAALTDPEVLQHDRTAIEIPLDVWRRVLDVNLTGYLIGCRHAIPAMIANDGGSIINMASGSGTLGDLARIAYGTSKAGVINLTRYIATQYGRQGIRCNAVAPGLITTPATAANAPAVVALASKYVLTRRVGTPEDVGALVAFLAADESGYITGECIGINGGKNACQPHFAEMFEQAL
ncbi:SDR family NAD(P)-dependent oxidoreductase [Pseudomonas lopnurensis]|uniref:SDR family NAD(P)-dependent oxidoreductase n=1 Tax=Pseudomonas lopnurensis TaxID=1477517 RepID=UPI0028AD77B2|nr:glucose 1-dehydrogenase [Pseudomonas lopnurensis]